MRVDQAREKHSERAPGPAPLCNNVLGARMDTMFQMGRLVGLVMTGLLWLSESTGAHAWKRASGHSLQFKHGLFAYVQMYVRD